MERLKGLAILGAGVVLGSVLSHSYGEVPHTKVITIHQPAKIVIHRETQTKTIRPKLPHSCVAALTHLSEVTNDADQASNATKKFYDLIDSLDQGPAAAHAAETELSNLKKKVDDSTYSSFTEKAELEAGMEACNRDIKEID